VIEHIIGAAVELSANNDDRELSVARPSRSVSAVRDASRVPGRWSDFASCVLDRESGATLDRRQSGSGARNPSSSASGRWQMLDASGWRSGGAWMVKKRLVQFGAPRSQAKAVRVYLARTPIAQWDGIWQDVAAFESLESGGWRHWANGDRCDRLVPS
jgi:hypothetical protein